MSMRSANARVMFRSIAFSVAAIFVLGFCGGCSYHGNEEGLVADNNRGVALMGRFDYEAAREVFAQLAESHPENADVLANLAIATLNRQQSGDDEVALEILYRALESDPGHLRSLYCQSLIFLYQGEAEPALAGFLQVFSVDPSDADAAYHTGQSLMQLERVGEAIEWYERSIDLDPYLRSAYYRGFQSLQRVGRRDEGRAMLETFQSLAENPRSRLVEFKYTKMGRRGAAATIDAWPEKAVEPDFGMITPFIWNRLADYQKLRILTFLDPGRDPRGAGYQIIQSKIAIGSGGVIGKGYLDGSQTRLDFLPEPHTDFIFSVLGEEFGLIGTVIVLLLFMYIFYRSIRIAAKCRSKFSSLMVMGAVAIIMFQFLVNIGMTLGFMPVTGLPLPFLSYGGTSLILFWGLIGLIVSADSRWQEY